MDPPRLDGDEMTTEGPGERDEALDDLGWRAVVATRPFAILVGVLILGMGGVLVFFLLRLTGG